MVSSSKVEIASDGIYDIDGAINGSPIILKYFLKAFALLPSPLPPNQ